MKKNKHKKAIYPDYADVIYVPLFLPLYVVIMLFCIESNLTQYKHKYTFPYISLNNMAKPALLFHMLC